MNIRFFVLLLGPLLLGACGEQSTAIVSTKIAYSHPEQVSGGFEITRRQVLGSTSKAGASAGQRLTLKDQSEVSFTHEIDAEDPGKIRVIVESKREGFPVEKKVVDYGGGNVNPPSLVFENGLVAAIQVSIQTKD